MICREQMDNPNDDGRYSLNGGRNDPNPQWCDCRQGECELDPNTEHSRRVNAGEFGGIGDGLD